MDNGNGGDHETPVAPGVLDGAVEDYSSPPKPDSPRTVWFRENREMLSKKEEEEKTAKDALTAKARQYMTDFHSERQSRIDKTKKINREDEVKAQELKERPEGSAWQQIVELIDFNLGAQQKDVSRARALLFQAKDADLPIADH